MSDLKTGGQTPTPRTDAIFDKIETPLMFEYETMRDFARTLERELNEMTEACNHWMDRYEQEHKDLAAHAEDRAMLETQLAEMSNAAYHFHPDELVLLQKKEIAALTAQLDAARRERDEAREAMANLQKQCFTLTTAESELAALRAELETVKAQLNSYRTHTL